jgi:hypothetical protein
MLTCVNKIHPAVKQAGYCLKQLLAGRPVILTSIRFLSAPQISGLRKAGKRRAARSVHGKEQLTLR